MSFTFSLTGNSSTLSSDFCPPIDLQETAEYSLGLISFETYNSIPNVDNSNNCFYYDNDDKKIEIPEGSYEIADIDKYITNYLAASRDILISIRSNNNTLKGEIKSNTRINFQPPNSIGRLLGFTNRELEPLVKHISDFPVKIQKVNTICIACNLVTGSYINNQPAHIIHEFFPSVPPGYKIIECPATVVYLPINKRFIDNITVQITDQNGELVNFRGEELTIRLHLKKNGT